jgi:IclR family transcriptional regulator, acetate operon repressor
MNDRRMSSLSKGLQLIQKFVFQKEAWGIREIARDLGFSKSATLRLLQSLCDEGYLVLTSKDSRYTIGPELWRLGVALRGKEYLNVTAMSVMRRYADKMNEMMIFFRYQRSAVVYEGVAECDHALRFSLNLGVPYPLHKGPAGKTILAFLPAAEASAVLDELSQDPSIDVELLKEQVRHTRTNGYSSARGERAAGVIGFAAPVIGPDRAFLGGVGLYLPEARYREEERHTYVDAVKACADEISSIVNP